MMHVDRLHCWVQKVLPLVYDDSLSYYEMLCRVIHKLNELIAVFDSDVIKEEVHAYVQSAEFTEWLYNYIESDEFRAGLADELNKRMAGFTKLAVFGDSNADGYGWYTGEGAKTELNDGWTAFLREMYPSLEIKNFANAGATILRGTGNDLFSQINTMQATGFIPDTIVIQAGGNDWNGHFDTFGIAKEGWLTPNADPSTTCGSFVQLVQTLQSRYPDTRIYYFVRPYMPAESYSTFRYCKDRIVDTALKLSIPVFDFTGCDASYYDGVSLRYVNSDKQHFSKEGYRRISRFIAGFLRNPIGNAKLDNRYWKVKCNAGTNLFQLCTFFKGYLATLPQDINFNGTLTLTGTSSASYTAKITTTAAGTKFAEIFSGSGSYNAHRVLRCWMRADNSFFWDCNEFGNYVDRSETELTDFPTLPNSDIRNLPRGRGNHINPSVLTGDIPAELKAIGSYVHYDSVMRYDDQTHDYYKTITVYAPTKGIYTVTFKNADQYYTPWRKIASSTV